MLLLCSCSADTQPGEPDAAGRTDAGGDTKGAGGVAGAGGGVGGTAGASGAGGVAGARGGAGGAAGAGGTSGGRAGAGGAGGVAGASIGGQAGTSSGDRDAATDRTDVSDAWGPSHDADTGVDGAGDGPDAPSSGDSGSDADVRFDSDAPPSDAGACSPLPATGVYATFRVVSDVFYASITNPTGIDQALALWAGKSQAKIPVGQLECSNGTYNCGWTWRMSPATITFAEITIEVCDATPSYVQGNCASFPNGSYCPWSAELIELRDCRTQASCPVVPR